MASSLNRVMIIGNVGREPELRYTPEGTATSRFSVAVNRRRLGPDNVWQDEEPEWFTVVVWRDLAEKVDAYIKKGQKVYVDGRLQTRKWTDPQGVEKRFTDLIANRIVVMGSARSGEEGATAGAILEEDDASGGIAESLNSFSVIGRLSDDPQYVADSTPRARFTLLVKHGWKTPDGEHKEVTEYIRVVAWSRLAETIGNNLSKGQKVFVEGRLQNRKYVDREGKEQRTTDLVANQVVFTGKPRGTDAAPGEEDQGVPMPDEADDGGGDIPF